MKPHKLIGVLEMSQASTQFYIDLINEKYSNGLSIDSQPFKLISTDFKAINKLLPKRSVKLDTLITTYLQDIPANDIECVLIPNITIHETVDAVSSKIDFTIPLAHPILGSIKRMRKASKSKAVLFGTAYTMTSEYIKIVFANSDIKIEEPKPEDLQFIDWIRREVYSESISAEAVKKFNDLVETYSDDTTVLLACTELSLVSKISNDCVLDMAAIQVEEAISMKS